MDPAHAQEILGSVFKKLLENTSPLSEAVARLVDQGCSDCQSDGPDGKLLLAAMAELTLIVGSGSTADVGNAAVCWMRSPSLSCPLCWLRRIQQPV